MLEGEAERRARDVDLAYYTAWHSGVFSQNYPKGKFPPFDKHQPRRKAVRRKTPEQLKAIAMAFTAAMGGTILKKS